MYLVFDFDGTIITEDSISHLAKAALQHHQTASGRDLHSQWNAVVQEYMQDRQQFKESFTERLSPSTPLQSELKFLDQVKAVEEASLARVKSIGLFNGIDAPTLKQKGLESRQTGKLKTRDGFGETLQLAREKDWKTAVISVNWSAAWILGVLSGYDFDAVIANEIGEDGGISGPDFYQGEPLTTALDKSKALEYLLQEGNDEEAIYFGDSETDIACLLRGGGVVITGDSGTDSSLMQTLKRVGVQVSHVDRGLETPIASARDFREVIDSGMLNGM